MSLLGSNNITECAGNLNFIPGDSHPGVSGHTQISQALRHWIQKNYL